MQYFPGTHATHNLYADVNGNMWYLYDDGSQYNNPPLTPPKPTDGCSQLDSEAIRQTILRQEAVFRQQVADLHGLYGKQRELENEIRRTQVNQQQRPQMGFVLSENDQSSRNIPNLSWLNPGYVARSVSHVSNVQLAARCVHSGVEQIEYPSAQCKLFDSQCKKYNKKVLDLQLSATEYIDDEDDRVSTLEEASEIHKHKLRKTSLNSLEKGHNSESSGGRLICLDLNEPFQLEETTFPQSADYAIPENSNPELFKDFSSKETMESGWSSVISMEKSSFDTSTNYTDLNNLTHETKPTYDYEAGKGALNANSLVHDSLPSTISNSADSLSLKPDSCHGVSERIITGQRSKMSSKKTTVHLGFSANNVHNKLLAKPKSHHLVVPISNKTNSDSRQVFSLLPSMTDFRRNPIAVQALPCMNAMPLMKKQSKCSVRVTGRDGNCYKLHKGMQQRSCRNRGLENLLVDKIGKVGKGKRGRRNVRARNSNAQSSNVNEDLYNMEFSGPGVPKKCTVEALAKGPASPENEECSPPRGESVEILDLVFHFSSVGHEDTQTDTAAEAAKTIVFMSASNPYDRSCYRFRPSFFSDSSPLHWFSEVISNVNSTGEESSADDNSFEAMTLKIEEAKTEEQYCRSRLQKEVLPGQRRRARKRTCRKLKDFQGDVLPSLSSLSRHEVTEDIQVIEGLIEAGGIPTSFALRRNGCGLIHRKKQLCVSGSIVAESTPCLLLDLQNESRELKNGEKILKVDWGKITKRQRGQRYPARRFCLSQASSILKARQA